MVDPDRQETASYLMVNVGGKRCGIPSQRVIKVLRRVSIQPFPAAARAFLGLTRFSSEAVAVMDGATLLGLREAPGVPPAEAVVVMVRNGSGGSGGRFGVLVDEALGLVAAPSGAEVGEAGDLVIFDPSSQRKGEGGTKHGR